MTRSGNTPICLSSRRGFAEAAIEAAQAGAAIVHIHVREPSTGQGSRRPEYFREVVERIRDAKTDVLINLTTGMGGDLVIGADGMNDTPAPGTDCVGPMERLVHVEELHPDICSLDCGSMNFDDDSMLFVMTPSYLRAIAKRIKELGVRPELEVFELGHIELSKRLIGEGLIDAPALFQICLGISYGAPATPQAMQAMLEQSAGRVALERFCHRKDGDAYGRSGDALRRQSPRRPRRQPLPFSRGARLERRSCPACKGGRGEPGRAACQYCRGSGPSGILSRPREFGAVTGSAGSQAWSPFQDQWGMLKPAGTSSAESW